MRVVDDVDEVAALTHPVRIAALAALRSPDSAAGVARAIGQSRQLVNYHLKELERAGLIVPSGERRKGNFVEQLYRVGRQHVRRLASSRLGWRSSRPGPRDQVSLEQLVVLGERLQRDAGELLDRAAFDGEQVASATVEGELSFSDESARSAFMTEYLAMLGPLLKKHGAKRRCSRYRVAVAVYPDHTVSPDHTEAQ